MKKYAEAAPIAINFTVDVDQGITVRPTKTLTIQQGEHNARCFQVSLVHNDMPVNLANSEVHFLTQPHKSDEIPTTTNCEIYDAENGQIMVAVKDYMSNKKGIINGEFVRVGKDGSSLPFKHFTISVDGSIFVNDGLGQSEPLHSLVSALARVQRVEEYLEQEFMDVEAKYAGELSKTNAQLSEDKRELSNRIDSIIALPDGSTIADAELIDIRTTANGINYASAGTAVRSQFSKVTKKINNVDKNLNEYLNVVENMLNPDFYVNGFISSFVGDIQENADWRTTDYLQIDNDKKIYCYFAYPSFRYLFYDINKKPVGEYGVETTNKATLNAPLKAEYLRVSYVKLSNDDSYDYSRQYIAYTDVFAPYQTPTLKITDKMVQALANEGIIPSNPSPSFGKLIIVDSNGAGQYTTITSAVENSTDGDTIVVMPGIYKEYVDVKKKDISIIGIDKNRCILWNDYGEYDKCPLYMTCGYLKNLTIKALKAEGAPDKTQNIPYCVHIDIYFNDDYSRRRLEIDNCDFVSDWSDCLGCGTADEHELIIKNCKMTNTEKSFRFPFAYHNTTSPSNAKITLQNNIMINNGTGDYCVYLFSYDAESLVDIEFIGNTCASSVNNINDSNLYLSNKFTKTITSHGNNVNSMNYL